MICSKIGPNIIWQCPVCFCTESAPAAKKFTRSAGPLGPRPERPWGPRAGPLGRALRPGPQALGPLGPRPERPRGPEAVGPLGRALRPSA